MKSSIHTDSLPSVGPGPMFIKMDQLEITFNDFASKFTQYMYCDMQEGLSFPHVTKYYNCPDKNVDGRAFINLSLI